MRGSSHVQLTDKPTAPQVLGDCGAVITRGSPEPPSRILWPRSEVLLRPGGAAVSIVGADPWLLRWNVNSLWTQEHASYELLERYLEPPRDSMRGSLSGIPAASATSLDRARNPARPRSFSFSTKRPAGLIRSPSSRSSG
jgi:hypothetical protein